MTKVFLSTEVYDFTKMQFVEVERDALNLTDAEMKEARMVTELNECAGNPFTKTLLRRKTGASAGEFRMLIWSANGQKVLAATASKTF